MKILRTYVYFVLCVSIVTLLQLSATEDTTPPSIIIFAPQHNSTVTGTVTLKALASDNVRVIGVQFYLDGNTLGAEDLTAPYSLLWDTTQTTNGNHSISALARDAAQNQATTVIRVIVGKLPVSPRFPAPANPRVKS